MQRRTFVTGALGVAASAVVPRGMRAAPGTPAAGLPSLAFTLTDTGFEIPAPLHAGRYEFKLVNAGASADSHTAIGKIPDRVTDAEYAEWLGTLARTDGTDGQTDAMTFDDIEFVGIPDWPTPGGFSSGVIDLPPGRYFLFDPFSGRGSMQLTVAGDFGTPIEPEADVTVTLTEMAINLPDAAITAEPVRWKIENIGAMSHEVAVIPVSADFTEEHLQLLFSLPDEATPPPGVPELVYQPAAAIGILAKAHTSWLDVRLAPGRYLAACFLPFGTGYPHAIDGMYRFVDIA